MEAVRNLKANLKLEGKACGWCQVALALGDDASVCTACEAPYHRACWESKAGCATEGCASAPLRRLDVTAPARPPAGQPIAAPLPSGPPGKQPPSPYPAAFAPRAPASPPPGVMHCPRCNLALAVGTPICPMCRQITSPDGLYHGPTIPAPGSVSALVLGIVGLVLSFVCLGVILGPLAIARANLAKRAIASDPIYAGGGNATAGLVMGIIATAVSVIIILLGQLARL